jgi:3D (Asp-Asp-Asp) domain-containing protein
MLRHQKKGFNTLRYALGFLICYMGLPLQASNMPALVTLAKEQRQAAALSGGRLGRVTAYWASEGDYYTRRLISSTGVYLHSGDCAVDPSIIPYGSVVEVAGVGEFLAVDTGSAVVSRKAARKAGHTSEERNALVIDLFFKSRKAGQAFAANAPKYAFINWRTPSLPSTFLPASVIVAPISILLRLALPIQPLRSPVERTPTSILLRLGMPTVAVLRSPAEIALQSYAID